MIEKLKELSLYLVTGAVVTGINHWIESTALVDFLKQNLVTLLIALLAINTTTTSVVMTKLKEIAESTGGNFRATVGELRHAIVEQLLLVIVAVFLLVLFGSKQVLGLSPWVGIGIEIVFVAVFSSSLYILFDTANAIFVILRFENRAK